jgi:hypothetical protein
MYRICVAGSRHYSDTKRVPPAIMAYAQGHGGWPNSPVEILSGHSGNVDYAAEHAAREAGLHLRTFVPDWRADGRAAGPLRNSLMIAEADILLAFWDGSSPGTKDSIFKAAKKGIPVFINPQVWLGGKANCTLCNHSWVVTTPLSAPFEPCIPCPQCKELSGFIAE